MGTGTIRKGNYVLLATKKYASEYSREYTKEYVDEYAAQKGDEVDKDEIVSEAVDEAVAKTKERIQKSISSLDPASSSIEEVINALQGIYQDAKYFTVTFADETGDGAGSVKVKQDTYVEKPQGPTADRDIFDGWYLGDATTAFDFEGTPITGDITLTARWTEAVASVTVGDKRTLYATLNGASQAAVADGVSEATITILRDQKVPGARGGFAIIGKGHDKTKVTVVNDYTVDFSGVVTTQNDLRCIAIDGATVTFEGTGTWRRTLGTHSMCTVGEAVDANKTWLGTVTTEEKAYAVVTINGGTFLHDGADSYIGQANVWNVQNGVLTVNGGVVSQQRVYSTKYCVRTETSEVGARKAAGKCVINGGEFRMLSSAEASRAIVCAKAGSLEITSDGSPCFIGGSSASRDAMKPYLAEGTTFVEDCENKYVYTSTTSFCRYTVGLDPS